MSIQKRLRQLNNTPIISIDAEANGLWGDVFAISAVVFDADGNETDRFTGRCPINGEVNPWVADNVLPKMTDIPETHESYESLLKAFFEFAIKYYKNEHKTLTHMGQVVEAKLLKDAHDLGIIDDWAAPYEWFDICLFFGASVDDYNKEHGIAIEGNPHNPVYDCIAAYKAFKHFVRGVD